MPRCRFCTGAKILSRGTYLNTDDIYYLCIRALVLHMDPQVSSIFGAESAHGETIESEYMSSDKTLRISLVMRDTESNAAGAALSRRSRV